MRLGERHLQKDPAFERLKTALVGKQPDRIPLFDFVISREMKENFLGKHITCLEEEVKFWVAAGYDYVVLNVRAPFRFNTQQSRSSEDAWHSEHMGIISSMGDYDTYPWPDPENLDYSVLQQIERYLPSGMKVITVAGNFYQKTVYLLGFENFALSLMDNPSFVARVMNRVAGITFRMLERVVEMPAVGAVVTGGDIAYGSGTMINPRFLRELVFPWYRREVEVCHSRDIAVIHHSDGNLWEVMDDLVDSGIDAFHPFEPAAMDIGEVKKRFGGTIGILGNVDVDLLSRGTPDAVRREVLKLIRELGPGGGYCVASSNSIHKNVRLDNYRAMIDATLNEGQIY